MDEKSKNTRQPEKRIEISRLNDPELVSSLSASADDIIFKIVRVSSIAATISSLSDSRYLEVSDSFIRLSGYGRDELIGHPLSEYTSGLNPGENDPAISILRKRKSTSKSKIKLKTKTGKGRICCITSNLIEINGQQCLLNYYEDIFTDRPDTQQLSQSDRKHFHLAEQAMLDSEVIYRAVWENSPAGICLTDKDGIYHYVNPAYCRMYGYSEEELLGHCYTDLISPKKNDGNPLENYNRAFELGKITPPGKTQFIKKNGEKIWIQFTGDFIWLNDKPQFLVSMNVDITELIQAEEKLKIFSKAINNSIDGIAMGNLEGRITYANEVFCKMFGYTKEELIGKEIALIYAEDQLPKLEKALKETMEGGWKGELIGKKKDGEIFPIAICSSRVVGDKGNVIARMASHRDITERKQAEDALKNSEERYRSVVENANEAILITQDELIKYSNPKITDISGYSVEELDLKSTTEFIHPEDREMIHNYYQKRLKGENAPKRYSFRIIHKDGSIRWLEITSTAITWENRPAILSFLHDITEQKQSELTLRKEQDFIRSLLDTANNLVVCLDEQARVTIFNSEFEKVSGYSRDEVIGKSWPEIFLPEDHHHHTTRDFAEWVRQHPRDVYEGPLKTKSGEIRTILWSNSALFHSDSDDFTAIAVGQDITERKKATEALKESEKKYRLLVENAGEPIFNVNSDGVFLTMNKVAAEYLSGKPSDFIGKTLRDLFPRHIAERQMESIKKAITSGKKINTTTKTILKNEEKWFITNIQPLISTDGKTTSALLIASDITEIKQHEVRGNARSQLIDNLRSAKEINECLKLGCQAIKEANMFRRAVMTLHNKAKEIIHAGYIGLEEDLVKIALKAPAPDDKLSRKMTQEKYRINHSYFIPVEDGLFKEDLGRYIPQQDNEKGLFLNWKNGDEFFVPIIGANNKPEGWLSVDTPFNGKRPALEDAVYLEEIIDIAGNKIHEIKSLELLRNERQTLHEKNITLREVLSHIEKEKMEIKHQVIDEIDSAMMPALKKLINNDGTVNKIYYNILNNCLQSLASSTGGIQRLFSKLSPREVEICSLIKNDASSKEIAIELNISLTTVQKHREIIRKKLGMTNKNINLASFLKNQ